MEDYNYYPKNQGYYQDQNYGGYSQKKKEAVVLMVAEKPSIAKTIATILSSKKCTKIPGKCKISPVYEYHSQFKGIPAFFRVTAVAGHIFTRDFPSRYRDWKSVDPEDLFTADTITIDDPRQNVLLNNV